MVRKLKYSDIGYAFQVKVYDEAIVLFTFNIDKTYDDPDEEMTYRTGYNAGQNDFLEYLIRCGMIHEEE